MARPILKCILGFLPIIFLAALSGCGDTTTIEEELAAEPGEIVVQDTLPSLEGKRVLMVYGGWPGHKPALFAEKAGALLKASGAIVIMADTAAVFEDSSLLASMDLIVQSITMHKITGKQMKGLETAVKNGVGFAGAHGGFCDAYRSNTLYQYMTGGQFVAHPGGQIPYTIQITDKDDPVSRDIPDFETTTEQYYVHVDPNVKVLATTTFSGEHDEWIAGSVMPIAWKKNHGKGRIFCLTIGHNPEEFDVEPAQTFLMNGLKWAGGSRLADAENLVSPVY